MPVFMMEALPLGVHQWELTVGKAIMHAKVFISLFVSLSLFLSIYISIFPSTPSIPKLKPSRPLHVLALPNRRRAVRPRRGAAKNCNHPPNPTHLCILTIQLALADPPPMHNQLLPRSQHRLLHLAVPLPVADLRPTGCRVGPAGQRTMRWGSLGHTHCVCECKYGE